MVAGRASSAELDVLVVGAGPTGLTLALQAAAHGARVAVVDRRDGTARPSRALVVHPRTLEQLAPLGASELLLRSGRSHLDAVLHAGGRDVPVHLGELPLPDTAHPRLLLVTQAAVEATLLELLTRRGVPVRWGVDVSGTAPDPDRAGTVALDRQGGIVATATFVVGCDGADSTVRAAAGIGFPGRPYRHPVVIGDVELGAPPAPPGAHVFAGRDGILFLFPAGERATWRVVVAGPGPRPAARWHRPARHRQAPHRLPATGPGDDPDRALAGLVHSLSDGAVSVRDVAWADHVPLRHHLADSYRRGSLLLAGDAAHVHSPAGAQGMNTGMQDACNLGWKLALAASAPPGTSRLLDSYERERRPVARLGIGWTSVAWWGESSPDPVARALRRAVVPAVAPGVARHLEAIAPGVRLVTGLALSYRRRAVPVAPPLSGVVGPRLRVGDRLPDLPLDGPAQVDDPSGVPARPHRLYELLEGTGHHLLLLGDGPAPAPDPDLPAGWVREVRLPPGRGAAELRRRLGPAGPTWCLVRPDRYIAGIGSG
ncbi:FAD-dependent monooxygenase [Phycicoccus ginsengisoli]